MTAEIVDTEPTYRRGHLQEVKAWVDLGDGWTALLRLVPRSHRFLVAEVRGFPRQGDDHRTHWSGAHSAVPRSLPIRRLQRLSLEDVVRHAEREYVDVLPPAPGSSSVDPSPYEGWGTDDPAMTPDERWARVALTYALVVARGSRAPTRETAEITGRKYEQVRDDLHAARVRGYLTREGVRGVGGGEFTEKGWQALPVMVDEELARYQERLS